LGRAADRIGRRTTILTCLAVMAIGMIGASAASGITILSAWRLLTGIGGMLARRMRLLPRFQTRHGGR
jgi:MFS family permease